MKFAGSAHLGAYIFAVAATLLTPQLLLAADPKVALKDEPRPSNIRLQETEMGVVFADSRGMTLYTDRRDPKPNTPACTDKIPTLPTEQEDEVAALNPLTPLSPTTPQPTCLTKHRPVEVGNAKPVGPWTVIDRSDGTKQWAYHGHAVYTAIKDLAPGQTWEDIDTGLRQYNKRFLILFAPLNLPPDIMVQQVGVAQVFATFSGRTLYTLTQDRAGKSRCEGACLEEWQPFLGGAMSQGRGEWSLAERADGTRQWALRGKPLYMFAADKKAGDFKGNNLPGAQVAIAHSPPHTPSFVTDQTTPVGDVYADAKGMTLYAFHCPGYDGGRGCDDAGEKSSWWFVTCGNTPEKCATVWQPVLAQDNAKPAGNSWTIVTMPLPWSPVRAPEGSSEPGVKVWAFKGRPVFTYKYEDRPGMIDGMDIGTLGGPRWFAIHSTGADLNAKVSVIQAAR